jgi:tRNA nucleotidyltransferase (CCA-adding enzyme)
MDVQRWEHFEHDADIGLRATAPTREALFEAMGEALTALVTDPAGVRASASVELSCEAPDDATLLVDWLNALIFEMATRRMLFGEWQVRLDGHRLRGRAGGEPVDRDRHQPVVEVKGATYTDLSIGQALDGTWHAQCIVDV